jgi:hypothetical protein
MQLVSLNQHNVMIVTLVNSVKNLDLFPLLVYVRKDLFAEVDQVKQLLSNKSIVLWRFPLSKMDSVLKVWHAVWELVTLILHLVIQVLLDQVLALIDVYHVILVKLA